MNFNDIFGGLLVATDWIETYIINGFLGNGFKAILNMFNTYMNFKPLIDFFVSLFSAFGG